MEIIWNNQQWLTEPGYLAKFNPLIGDEWIEENIFSDNMFDWTSLREVCKNKFILGTPGFYPRAGKNIGPWKRDKLLSMFDLHMPLSINSELSFAEATDARCQQLLRQHKNKIWYVFWSGGTDSTVIVSSLLKNTVKADREKIFIVCNRDSIFEYPQFYFDFIEPNFKLIEANKFALDMIDIFGVPQNYGEYITIDGNPADQLHRSRDAYNLKRAGIANIEPKKNYNVFLKYYTEQRGMSLSAARWLYENMLSNIESTTVPITTFLDWDWWFFFNFSWVGVKMRCYTKTLMSYQQFVSSYIMWYDSQEYQTWALSNSSNIDRNNLDIFGYKIAAKQYIHSLTKDDYYFYFKQKGFQSIFTKTHNVGQISFAVADDGSHLYLEKHLEKILELLPKHRNQ